MTGFYNPNWQEATSWLFTSVTGDLSWQARNQGGGGCIHTPPQAPKVRILILNIQVKACSQLN